MARKNDPSHAGATGASREDRLKAALKANLARRKAQAKNRSAQGGSGDAIAKPDTAGHAPDK